MSVEAISAVKWIDCPTPTVKLVLFVLANYADERGSCFPSAAHIGKICGISPRQVQRCIKDLEKMNVVRTEARVGTSNRYFITLDALVRGGGVTHDRGVTTRVSTYTKHKLKKKKEKSLNELAG